MCFQFQYCYLVLITSIHQNSINFQFPSHIFELLSFSCRMLSISHNVHYIKFINSFQMITFNSITNSQYAFHFRDTNKTENDLVSNRQLTYIYSLKSINSIQSNTRLKRLSLTSWRSLWNYTAQQKHESTLLHTYVLNEFLTSNRSCTTQNLKKVW